MVLVSRKYLREVLLLYLRNYGRLLKFLDTDIKMMKNISLRLLSLSFLIKAEKLRKILYLPLMVKHYLFDQKHLATSFHKHFTIQSQSELFSQHFHKIILLTFQKELCTITKYTAKIFVTILYSTLNHSSCHINNI